MRRSHVVRRNEFVLSPDGHRVWHLMHVKSRNKMTASSLCLVPVLPRPPENPVLKPFLTCIECAVALARMVP